MNRKKKKNKKWLVILVLISSLGLAYLTYYNKIYIEGFIREIFYYPVVKFSKTKELYTDGIDEELKKENQELRGLLDIDESLSKLSIINATVISRDTNFFFSFFTINKGSLDGILKGMAVVNGDGLVGIIDSVTKHTAAVKLITSTDTRNKVSVKIKSEDGNVISIMTIDENKNMVILGIDKNDNIKKGDIVTTSGLSDIFPSGIMIGYIDKVEEDKYKTSIEAYVTLSTDIFDIHYVAVLKRGE